MGLAYINDLQSYTSKSLATGRSAHTAEVLSEVLDTERYHDPPVWGLGFRLMTPSS
jgi:hypothetical protein